MFAITVSAIFKTAQANKIFVHVENCLIPPYMTHIVTSPSHLRSPCWSCLPSNIEYCSFSAVVSSLKDSGRHPLSSFFVRACVSELIFAFLSNTKTCTAVDCPFVTSDSRWSDTESWNVPSRNYVVEIHMSRAPTKISVTSKINKATSWKGMRGNLDAPGNCHMPTLQHDTNSIMLMEYIMTLVAVMLIERMVVVSLAEET